MRKSGILLPITSLPSEYGIGCFSQSAYDFIDWLAGAGQSYWQILPLCPTGFGDSPYQSFSTFAGNPYMISLKELIKEGLLSKEECDAKDLSDNECYIDYKKQYENRFPLLEKAYDRSNVKNDVDYNAFITQNSYWLDDYSMFMSLKDNFKQKAWNEWPKDIRQRQQGALEMYRIKLKSKIDFWKFVQYKFYTQWNSLKSYANKNNINIIGDVPLYVSFDSADVWSNPHLYELDEEFIPTHVAGCPPDSFSKTGQLWGNPLYKWENHRLTQYKWWIQRLDHAFKIYDIVRLDHFRGFDEYYSIKYPSIDAADGKWEKGPGAKFFKTIQKEIGKKNFIAEDLGFITDSVKNMLAECNFPGMKVLEFAFDSWSTATSGEYLPHNYPKSCVAYTGTHDNQTISSWFQSISENARQTVRNYLSDQYTPNSEIHIPIISLIMRSAASLCIVPLQDWLGLSDSARINIPSTTGNNWRWRTTKRQLSEDIKRKIYDLTAIYERL